MYVKTKSKAVGPICRTIMRTQCVYDGRKNVQLALK